MVRNDHPPGPSGRRRLGSLIYAAHSLDRGFHVVQGREPRPRTLPEGRQESYPVCPGHVSQTFIPAYYSASSLVSTVFTPRPMVGLSFARRITKLRENCLETFNAHWNCLEDNNQVRYFFTCSTFTSLTRTLDASCGLSILLSYTTDAESQRGHSTTACLRSW